MQLDIVFDQISMGRKGCSFCHLADSFKSADNVAGFHEEQFGS